MANAKKNQKVVAPEVAAETIIEQVAETPAVETAEANAADATEESAEVVDQAPEKGKRERSYSQTAVDTADLERLNQLKTFIKEKLNVSVSNQRIIAAALDCLGENTEAFLKGIVAEANNKQLAKDRKAYELLKAKFEAAEAATKAEIQAELDAAEAPAAK